MTEKVNRDLRWFEREDQWLVNCSVGLSFQQDTLPVNVCILTYHLHM